MATPQGVMNQNSHKYLGKLAFGRLDDLLVFAKNEEKHMSKILKFLCEY